MYHTKKMEKNDYILIDDFIRKCMTIMKWHGESQEGIGLRPFAISILEDDVFSS